MTHDPGGKSKPKWPSDSRVVAKFSNDQCYRYSLEEVWDNARPLVMFLMMNPSVAGVEHSDPTLRRTGNFARAWGYGGQLIGNVHAYRATNPANLLDAQNPVGPYNDTAMREMAQRADRIILAYGKAPGPLHRRALKVHAALRADGYRLSYLRLSQDGTPMHPLYLPGNLVPVDFT